ncbi:MAG: DUF1018 domain-containing protein [Thermoplasmata archaeon]|nr:DUF1018 domain-containing protein [Thermoplasmata archaeon]
MSDIFDTIEIKKPEQSGDIFDRVASQPAGDIFDRVSTVPDTLTPEMQDLAYETYKSTVAPKAGQLTMGFSKQDFLKQPDMAKKWAALAAKPRSHFEKLAESAKRGKETFELDQDYFNAAMFGEGNPEEVYRRHKLMQAAQQLDPIEGENLLKKMEYGTASILPGMIMGTQQALPLMAAGGVIGTAGGPAGIAAGIGLGWKTGSAYAWYRQGAGEMMLSMKDKGITGNVQKIVGGIAGVPYALIEQMQWVRVTPGMREGVNVMLNQSMKKFAAQVVAKYGVTLATETAEEVMQEGIAILAEDLASYLTKNEVPFNKKDLMERVDRLKETAIQSVVSMALLPVPGAVIDVTKAKAFINPDTPNAVPDIVATTEVKDVINETTDLTLEQKDVALKYIGDIETNIVKEAVVKFPEPINSQESLERVGNAIKEHLGITQDVKWTWSNRKVTGQMGWHLKGEIAIMAKHRIHIAQPDMIKDTIVHELGHLKSVQPPIEPVREPGRIYKVGQLKRSVHHAEFKKWVAESIKRMVEVKESVKPVPGTPVGPIGPSGFNYAATQEAVKAHNEQGGSTINVSTGQPVTKGFAVAIDKKYEKILDTDKITEQDIEDYKTEHTDYLRRFPDVVVGTWVENGKTYLGLSMIVSSKETALKIGKHAGKLAIFDLEKMESIPVEQEKPPVETEEEQNKAFIDAVRNVEQKINERGYIVGDKGKQVYSPENAKLAIKQRAERVAKEKPPVGKKQGRGIETESEEEFSLLNREKYKPNETLNEYDYERQERVTGEAARQAKIKMRKQTIQILQSDSAKDFIAFQPPPQNKYTVKQALQNEKAELSDLESMGILKTDKVPADWKSYIEAIQPSPQQGGGIETTLYHSTTQKHLESIAKEGLTKDYAGEYPHGIKERPDLDTKQMIYFSDVEGRAKEFGGNILLRVNKSELAKEDIFDFQSFKNVETRYWGKNIPPDKLEIKVNNEWIPFKEYAQVELGIKLPSTPQAQTKPTTEHLKTKPSLIDKLFKKFERRIITDVTKSTATFVSPEGKILDVGGTEHYSLAHSIKTTSVGLLKEGIMRTRDQSSGFLIEFGRPPTGAQLKIAKQLVKDQDVRRTVVSWYDRNRQAHWVEDTWRKPTEVLNQALKEMQAPMSVVEAARKRAGVEYMKEKPGVIKRSTALRLGHSYPRILKWNDEQRRKFMVDLVGKRSMKEMTDEERTKVVQAMEQEIRNKGLSAQLPPSRKNAEEATLKLIVGDQLVNFSDILDEATDVVEKLPDRNKITGVITAFKGRWGHGPFEAAKAFFFGVDNDHVSTLAYVLSGGKKNAITKILDENKQSGTQREAAVFRGGIDLLRQLNKDAGITDEDLEGFSRSLDPRFESIKTIREVSGKSKTKYYEVKINSRTYSVSMGQLIDFYLAAQQEDGLKHLSKSGWFVSNTFTGPLDVLTIKRLTDYVGNNPKAKALADNMVKVGVEYQATTMNLVSGRLEGEDIANEKNYWHLEPKTHRKMKGKGLLSISFLENKGLLKPRTHTGKGALICRDAFDRFLAVHFAVSEYVGMAEPLRAMTTLLNYEPFATVLETKGYGRVKNNIITITERAQDVRREGGYITRAIASVLRGAYRAVLTFNPRVIGSQYVSTVQYAGVVADKYLHNIGKGLNPKLVAEMLEHNDVAWARYNMSHQSLEMAEMGQLDATLQAFTGKTGDINKAAVALKLSDICALSDGYQMAKEMATDAGLKEGTTAYYKEVNRIAEDLWLRTQPSWDKWNRSVNTSNPTVLRQTVFLFRSYYEKALSMLHRANSEYAGSEKTATDKKAWSRVYGSVLASQVVTAFLRTMISWGLWRQRKSLWDFISDMLAAPLAMIPVLGKFLGTVLTRFIKIVAKEKSGYRPDAIEVLPVGVVNTTLRGVAEMTEAAAYFIAGDTDRAEKQMQYATRNIVRGLGTAKGVPVGIMETMEKGWLEDEEESSGGGFVPSRGGASSSKSSGKQTVPSRR